MITVVSLQIVFDKLRRFIKKFSIVFFWKLPILAAQQWPQILATLKEIEKLENLKLWREHILELPSWNYVFIFLGLL